MRERRWRADCGSSRERFRASQPQQFGVAIRSTQIANLTCLAVLAVFDQLSEFPNCFRPPPAHLAGLEIGRGQTFGEFDRYTLYTVDIGDASREVKSIAAGFGDITRRCVVFQITLRLETVDSPCEQLMSFFHVPRQSLLVSESRLRGDKSSPGRIKYERSKTLS